MQYLSFCDWLISLRIMSSRSSMLQYMTGFPSFYPHCMYMLLPWWLRRLSVCLQCGRPGFDPWVRKIPWRRKWQSTPVLLPGKSHGQRSLVGYSPWGHKESDTTERLYLTKPHESPLSPRAPRQNEGSQGVYVQYLYVSSPTVHCIMYTTMYSLPSFLCFSVES